MNTYSDVFVGIVDILGYKNVEESARNYGKATEKAILSNILDTLDNLASTVWNYPSVQWSRYGDGYIFFSKDEDPIHLLNIIERAARYLALTLNSGIPIRLVITQGDFNEDFKSSGGTVSGRAWNILLDLEKALNWMGGLLYFPQYDGKIDPTVKNMICSTQLIKEQSQTNSLIFTPPYKPGQSINRIHAWYLNWFRVLKLPKHDQDLAIRNWWIQLSHCNNINDHTESQIKQDNAISFADYCREIVSSARLLHNAEICPNIEKGAIV